MNLKNAVKQMIAAMVFVLLAGVTASAHAASSNLVLSQKPTLESVPIGRNLAYEYDVTNFGPDDANGVVWTFNLPVGSDYVASQPDCLRKGRVLTCNLGYLRNGQTKSVLIITKPTIVGTLTHSASVRADNSDAAPANNNFNGSAVITSTDENAKAAAMIAPSAVSDVCGPMDVAFVIDTTSSMRGAINNVKSELAGLLDDIETASGNNYRLSLVTFGDDISVQENFSVGNRASIAAKINNLSASGGGGSPEASDEALNTVVNTLPASGRPQDIDFTPGFRRGVHRIILFVTDALPAGFDDRFTLDLDDIHAHQVAQQAATMSINIESIYVPTGNDSRIKPIMQDYADTTGGLFTEADSDGTGSGRGFRDAITACGGSGFLSINNVSLTEGDNGTKNATFTVTLSAASTSPVTVHYATSNGTARAGSDYVAVPDTLITFAPGQISKTIDVSIIGDTTVEPNATFAVNLSNATGATIADAQGIGTITDNDSVSAPTLSINNVAVTEGDNGAKNATFIVTLSATSNSPVTVSYATANGNATAGSDYTAKTGTLTIPAGQISGTIDVSIIGDTIVEPDETFAVNLSNATGATIADAQGIGTIRNDDSAADLVLTKTASPNPIVVGGNLVYTLRVTNNGPNDAAGVTLTDTLPASVTFVSASPAFTRTGNTITFALSSIANGANKTAVITVKATMVGNVTNTANVTATTTDPIAANNRASQTTLVNPSVLRPTITSFSPPKGPVGTRVVITGTNFTGATIVKFNGLAATFTVNSATQITAIVPTRATKGRITVTTPAGTAISATDFLVAPVITLVSPNWATTGSRIVVRGLNFDNAYRVTLGGYAVPFTLVDNTTITFFVPGTAGGLLSVTTPAGTAISAIQVINSTTFEQPFLYFSPARARIGETIRIRGAIIMPFNPIDVRINGVPATNVRRLGPGVIEAAVPRGVIVGALPQPVLITIKVSLRNRDVYLRSRYNLVIVP